MPLLTFIVVLIAINQQLKCRLVAMQKDMEEMELNTNGWRGAPVQSMAVHLVVDCPVAN